MIRAKNPFIVTGLIEKEYFCDRINESARFFQIWQKSRRNCCIQSPWTERLQP